MQYEHFPYAVFIIRRLSLIRKTVPSIFSPFRIGSALQRFFTEKAKRRLPALRSIARRAGTNPPRLPDSGSHGILGTSGTQFFELDERNGV